MNTPKNSIIRPAGHLIQTRPDGEEVTMDTHKCPHCQRHFAVKPGSGKLRSFCMKCMAPTCGNPRCMAVCCEWERKLENLEKGRDRYHKPIKVSMF